MPTLKPDRGRGSKEDAFTASLSTVKEAATEESDSIPGQVFKPTMFD